MIKIKKYRSSGKIISSYESREGLSKGSAPRSLIRPLKRKAGRDQQGHISVRHRGGGSKRKYRLISNLESLSGEEVKVLAVEYDPNRTARIALVELKNGQKKYIIAGVNMVEGKVIRINPKNPQENDRAMLKNIPLGSSIYNLQIRPQSNSCIARAAGASAVLMSLEGDYAQVKLPSGETRRFRSDCFATIGQVSNIEHSKIAIGKAGRKRRMGIRPTVRGKAMYPAAHPHGGGEGVNPIGLKYPKTPWGKPAIGKKTRRNRRTQRFIIKERGKING